VRSLRSLLAFAYASSLLLLTPSSHSSVLRSWIPLLPHAPAHVADYLLTLFFLPAPPFAMSRPFPIGLATVVERLCDLFRCYAQNLIDYCRGRGCHAIILNWVGLGWIRLGALISCEAE
jgi:hypothetical protein